MKRRTTTRLLYVVIAFALSSQNLKAQAVDPPESLPESPLYNEAYIIPIFCDDYTGTGTINKFSVTAGSGTQVSVLDNDMIKFTGAIGGWSFAEFNEVFNLEAYDFLSFDVYNVQADFFIKVRFNDASTPPGSSYRKAGGTAKQGEWTRIVVDLKAYYAAVTATKPDYANIAKIAFINHGGQTRTAYIDNIYAYKSTSLPSLTNISKNSTDMILAGPWDDTTFGSLDNAAVTSLDITDVAGLTDKPTVTNPNCLVYTNNAAITGTNVVVNGVAEAGVSIQEGSSFNNVKPFVANSISYSREYNNAGWGSLCLPYALEAISSDLKVYAFSTASGTSVTFEPVELLEANTPYIVQIPTTGQKDFSLSEGSYNVPVTKMVSVEKGDFAFKGTFSQIPGKGMYLLNKDGSGFANGGNAATIPGFRAYIEDKTGAGDESRKLSLGFTGGGTTNIEITGNPDKLDFISANGQLIVNAGKTQAMKIYALDGRIVNTIQLHTGENVITDLPKGLFIIDRQKVEVK